MPNNLLFMWISTSIVCINISNNKYITLYDNLLYYFTLIAIVSCLTFSYLIKMQMGKSYDMNDFDLKQNKNHQLMTDGYFQYVRHPMYTFSILASFSTVVATKFNLISMIFFSITTIRFIFSIPREEKTLTDIYKDKYKQYQQKTKYRLIPFIW